MTEQQSPLYSMETWKKCRNVVSLYSRRQPSLCYLLKKKKKKEKKKKDRFVHKALYELRRPYELRSLILDIGLLFRILLRKDGYTESDDLVNHRKIQTSGGEKCR